MKAPIIAFMLSIAILLIFIGSYWLYEANVFKSNSRASQIYVSGQNSYCFTSPLCVSADGLQTERISIFCLSDQGVGVSGLSGKLASVPSLTVRVVQGKSDTQGAVLFDVSSKTKGETELDVYCGATKIDCRPRVCFN